MQNAAFTAMGVDARYVALDCAAEDLAATMRTLINTGGGGNVTVPHKGLAVAAGRPNDRVTMLGAANVFAGQDGEVVLSNTDVDGLLAMVARLEADQSAWCVMGTGGSARAAVGAAAAVGASIAVRSRDPLRAAEFATWAATLGVPTAAPEACQVLINATPVGLSAGDRLQFEWSDFPLVDRVIDLTYRREGKTELVRDAQVRGFEAIDGREMLVVQGALAWREWLPGITAPLEIMRAAVGNQMG
jgi:shikimate dehydrogenase